MSPQLARPKVALVVNPVKVPDADAVVARARLRAALAGAPPPLRFDTTVDDPGTGQARDALARGADVVLACGGDGTVTACARALAGSDAALAVLPRGTGNLLARNLGVPLDTDGALDVAFGPARRRVDVLDAGDRQFLVMAGVGFDAALVRETDEEAKGRFGWLAYVLAAGRALRSASRRRFHVTVDGVHTVRAAAVGALVGNVGTLRGGMTLFPDARPDDGLLDVLVFAPRGATQWLSVAWHGLRGRAHRSPHAQTLRGREVRIVLDDPLPVEFDGDHVGEVTELTVRVRPRALRLCAPPPGARPEVSPRPWGPGILPHPALGPEVARATPPEQQRRSG
ncbi:MAG: diacylglycerol kinase family lipid kinase [Actinomycetota bacterium]|nr:diacylglycerol kinase family lipid kinase [Actinomycetota bacterium]